MSGEPENGGSKAAKIVGAAVGFATFLGCVASLLSGESESETTTAHRKTMKAPGRDGKIFRDEFEENPYKYFKDLRKK